MASFDIRLAVDEFCVACAHSWGPKAIHEGAVDAISVVDACPLHLCALHAVRPRRGRT